MPAGRSPGSRFRSMGRTGRQVQPRGPAPGGRVPPGRLVDPRGPGSEAWAPRAGRSSRAAPRPEAESRRAGWSTLRVGSLVPPRPRNARLALVGTSGRDRGGSAGRPRPAPANHYHSCRYNLGPAGRAATRPLHRPDSASADGLPEVQRGATRPNRFPPSWLQKGRTIRKRPPGGARQPSPASVGRSRIFSRPGQPAARPEGRDRPGTPRPPQSSRPPRRDRGSGRGTGKEDRGLSGRGGPVTGTRQNFPGVAGRRARPDRTGPSCHPHDRLQPATLAAAASTHHPRLPRPSPRGVGKGRQALG